MLNFCLPTTEISTDAESQRRTKPLKCPQKNPAQVFGLLLLSISRAKARRMKEGKRQRPTLTPCPGLSIVSDITNTSSKSSGKELRVGE